MDVWDELVRLEEEILFLKDKVRVLESKTKGFKESLFRDMADRWELSKDLCLHPVTGSLKPVDAEKILFEQVAKKCRKVD